MLPMIFFGTGVLLVKLRKHALNANECHDFDEQELEAAKDASLRTCCSDNALTRMGGGEGGFEGVSGSAEEAREISCKFCDEDASCRFCFGGPEKGELIAPCACVGSQEFVHTKCLQQWRKIAMRTKGNTENHCRVCHARFRLPSRPVDQRVKLWFSFKAKDRLNAYSRVWLQNLLQMCVAHKRSVSPAVFLARWSSAQDLAVMLASTEVRIWAGREVRHGKTGLHAVKTMGWFCSAVNVLSRLKAAGVF